MQELNGQLAFIQYKNKEIAAHTMLLQLLVHLLIELAFFQMDPNKMFYLFKILSHVILKLLAAKVVILKMLGILP